MPHTKNVWIRGLSRKVSDVIRNQEVCRTASMFKNLLNWAANAAGVVAPRLSNDISSLFSPTSQCRLVNSNDMPYIGYAFFIMMFQVASNYEGKVHQGSLKKENPLYMDDIQRVGPLFLWRFYPFPVTPLPPRLSSSKQITRQARNQSWFLFFVPPSCRSGRNRANIFQKFFFSILTFMQKMGTI